jgi:hypothetical protein
MSLITRTVWPPLVTSRSARNATVLEVTAGNAIRFSDTKCVLGSLTVFATPLRRHRRTRGSVTVRCQSRATICGVRMTWTSLWKSRPVRWNSEAAAPVTTRSDCFGL